MKDTGITGVTAKQSLQSIVDKTELADEIRFSAQEAIRQIGDLENRLEDALTNVSRAVDHENETIRRMDVKLADVRAKVQEGISFLENLPRFWGRRKSRKLGFKAFFDAIEILD